MENKRKFNVRLSEICEVLGVDCPIEDREITKIAHIRRNVEEGCVYFAFKNWRVDTYANIDYAIEHGAVLIVTERYIEDFPCVVVEDTLKAFMKLAGWNRAHLDIDVVGITGSVGKTSTKEMIYSALSVQNEDIVEKNSENANSLDLAAMNTFDLYQDTEILVQEMAIQDLKESSMAIAPTYAVITNIGVSHIEEFGSREEIYHHKLEILAGMKGGKAFFNIDDDMLYDYFKTATEDSISYAIENEEADCRATDIEQCEDGYRFVIHYKGGQWEAHTNCPGKHNVLNALVAFAIGYEMGKDKDALIEGIKQYQPTGFRQNVLQIGNVTLLADCFNAAPKSMKAALDTLESMGLGKRKIAVLGDMLELGTYSKEFHEEVGHYVNTKQIDELICYGNESKYLCDVVNGNKIKVSSTLHQKELIQLVEEAIKTDCVILFKASHGMMLEEIIDEVFHTKLSMDVDKDKYIWDLVEREGKDIKDYLERKGYHSVAVYGLTTIGENLISYLNQKGIAVKYAIDKRAKYAPSKLYPCPIYMLKDELSEVDVMLISYYSKVDDVIDMIKEKINVPCIPYRKMVEEMLEM